MARSWTQRTPKTKTARHALRDRCGRRAFVDPKRLKYPVVAAQSRSCEPTCEGAASAYKRAARQHHPTIRDAALRLGQRLGCPWVKGSARTPTLAFKAALKDMARRIK